MSFMIFRLLYGAHKREKKVNPGDDRNITPITIHITKEHDGWRVLSLSLNASEIPQAQG